MANQNQVRLGEVTRWPVMLANEYGTPTSAIYRFLREENGVFIYQSRTGQEVTWNDIQSFASTGGFKIIPLIGRIGAIDYLDFLNMVMGNALRYRPSPEDRRVLYSGMMEDTYNSWNRLLASGGSSHKVQQALWGLRLYMDGSMLFDLGKDIKGIYKASEEEVERKPFEDFIREVAGDKKWDLADPNTKQTHMAQMWQALVSYITKHYPDYIEEHGGNLEAALAMEPWGSVIAAMGAMEDGEDWAEYIEGSTDEVRAIVEALAGNVERMGGAAEKARVSVEEADKETIFGNVNTILKNFQATYGAEEGTRKFQEYSKRYMEEMPFVKPTAYPIPGMEGEFEVPDLLLPEDVRRFEDWVKAQEAAEAEAAGRAIDEKQRAMEARRRAQQQGRNIEYIRQQFVDAFGNPELANILMEEAIRYGNDLSTASGLGAFMSINSPAQVEDRWIPPSVQEVYTALGLDTSQLMASIGRETKIGDWQPAVLAQALQQGQAALAQGTLAPEIQENLVGYLNTMIATLPPPGEGQRQFYQTKAGAQEQFQTYLAGQLPGEYRTAAWEYFPQLWERFPGKAEVGGREKFEEYVTGLGPTFFARLTPKKERVSGPRTMRPPGGGRPAIG